MLHRSSLERRNSTQNNKTDLKAHYFLSSKEFEPVQAGKKEKVSVARLYLLLDWSKVVLELVMLLCSLASALKTALQLCMQGKLYFLTVLQ